MIDYTTYGLGKADDKRECLGMSAPSGCNFITAYAYMVNDDYTVKAVTVMTVDYDYEDRRNDFDHRVAVTVDATPETVQKVRAKCIADHIAKGEGLFISDFAWRGVKPGDVVTVVKGRKYAYGTEITVADTYAYRDCYNRHVADYIVGINGEKVDLKNCEIKSLGDGTVAPIKKGSKIEVVKDIINPTTGEVKYTAGTVVVVAGTETRDYDGKKREYYLGTNGERIFKPYAKRI